MGRHAIKCGVTYGRPCADRISFAFAIRLYLIRTTLREDQFVLDEMDYLEGLRTQSKTKKEMQFPHPPLHDGGREQNGRDFPVHDLLPSGHWLIETSPNDHAQTCMPPYGIGRVGDTGSECRRSHAHEC